jgi:hypothetical protein
MNTSRREAEPLSHDHTPHLKPFDPNCGACKREHEKAIRLDLKVTATPGFAPATRDSQLDSRHYEGEFLKPRWIRVVGEADCGCVFDLEVSVDEGVSFREAVNYFGAQYSFGGHTHSHTDLCLVALSPEVINGDKRVDAVSSFPVGELVRNTV